MNIIAADTAPPNMFLVGFRAPPGVPFDAVNPNAEEVGVVIARSRVRLDGTVADPGDVLDQDQPYDPLPAEGPFRLESDLSVWKPVPDVVIVDRLENFLTPAQLVDLGPPPDLAAIAGHIAGSSFGTVAIDRGAGFGAALPRPFGWLGRGVPPRLALAGRPGAVGDASSLEGFDAAQHVLVDDYENGFQNGRPLPGEALFAPGDRLRFSDSTGPIDTVTVPAAPTLAVTQDGEPLDPPLALAQRVDTVVFDREAGDVTFTWRAVFPWDARYENADLEIS